MLIGFNDLETLYPQLLIEWDYEKNTNVSPNSVTPGSDKKVWWKCSCCGYEWYINICKRVAGNGYPVCVGKKVLVGYNDLTTTAPHIAQEWNYDKNIDMQPTSVTKNSNKKVWWKCKYGHEWQASVNNRTNGRGCPYCANQKVLIGFNDLSSQNPQLAKQWHPTKNQELLPTEVIVSSSKKAWWLCDICGHEWEAAIFTRNKGSGCPICARKKKATQ